MKKDCKNYYVVKSYNKLFDGWFTEKQWKKKGFILKSGAVGTLLYTNGNCTCVAIYYPYSMVMFVPHCKRYVL